MKSRFLKTVLLAAVIVGGIWVLVNRDRIRHPRDVVNILQGEFSATQIGYSGSGYPSENWSGGQSWGQHGNYYAPQNPIFSNAGQNRRGQLLNQSYQRTVRPGPQFVTNVIRIASFKLNPTITSVQDDFSLELLADICRRYDAIAFQEISRSDNTWLARLTDRMNAMGAQGVEAGRQSPARRGNGAERTDYFYISDRDHNVGSQTQSAIVFNRSTLEHDQAEWYTVSDPDNLLSREPIVAWFRARGPAPDRALTFTLVNLEIDAAHRDQELAHLGNLFRAIRNDGRGEDDVLIVGDFHAGDRGLQPVKKESGLTWVVSNRPTDTKYQSQFDNLVFSEAATVEFTGRGGVFDFLRHYNLGLEQALQISEHVPVWAEFSIFEGSKPQSPQVEGTPGRVAEGEAAEKL